MATPLSADRFVAALKAEGVTVAEYSGWRTHNRNHKGNWGPVNGVTIHHTAGSNSLAFVYNGNAALPGPLCHTHLAKSGVATMVGNGRANHAGTFAANAHEAVVNESPTHPRPDAAEPVDGNAHYYGIEIENLGDGKDPYPSAQYDAAVRWAAAICRAHGWSENSVIGHKEGTRRKIDPSFDMNAFRQQVGERLKHAADWNPTDEEDPLATWTKEDIYSSVWSLDKLTAPADAPDVETNPTWAPGSYLRDTNKRVRALEKSVAAQNATITELVKTVVALSSNVTALDPDALVARITGAIEEVTIRLDIPDA